MNRVARLGQISSALQQGLPDWAGNLTQSGNTVHAVTRSVCKSDPHRPHREENTVEIL